MICPHCGGPAALRRSAGSRAPATDRLIVDSRVERDRIRRRRVCATCGERFTTRETPEAPEQAPTASSLIDAAITALRYAKALAEPRKEPPDVR